MEIENIKPKSKKKLILIAAILFLVVTVFVIIFFVFADKPEALVQKILQPKEDYEILLGVFVLNIRPEDYTKNYLKIEIALNYSKKKHLSIINSNMNRIRDTVINVLSSQCAGELLDKDNMKKIKKEMQDNINKALEKDIIHDIYLANMVIQ